MSSNYPIKFHAINLRDNLFDLIDSLGSLDEQLEAVDTIFLDLVAEVHSKIITMIEDAKLPDSTPDEVVDLFDAIVKTVEECYTDIDFGRAVIGEIRDDLPARPQLGVMLTDPENPSYV